MSKIKILTSIPIKGCAERPKNGFYKTALNDAEVAERLEELELFKAAFPALKTEFVKFVTALSGKQEVASRIIKNN